MILYMELIKSPQPRNTPPRIPSPLRNCCSWDDAGIPLPVNFVLASDDEMDLKWASTMSEWSSEDVATDDNVEWTHGQVQFYVS